MLGSPQPTRPVLLSLAVGTKLAVFPGLTSSHPPPEEIWCRSTGTLKEDKQESLWALQSLCLEPEDTLLQSTFFWSQAPRRFPGDVSGPQLWCWLLRTAPLGGSWELLTIFQTPWKKGSCSQPRKCPLRNWLCGVFSLSLSLLLHSSFLVIVPGAGSGNNLPFTDSVRQKVGDSALTILAWWAYAQSTASPLLSWEKRKQMLTMTPWEFTLLCCKILHY